MQEQLFFWPETFCVSNDTIWFVYGKASILCKYDMLMNETIIVSKIPVDFMDKQDLFNNIIYKNNKLYLIPCWAKDVVIYDIQLNEFSKILLRDITGLKFSNAFLVEDKIICTPFVYDYIIEIDTNTDTIISEFELDEIKKDFGVTCFNYADIENNLIAMVSPQSNRVFYYDIYLKHVNTVEVGIDNTNFEFIAFHNNELYLTSLKTKRIYIFNPKSKLIKKEKWLPKSADGHVWSVDKSNLLVENADGLFIKIYNNNSCVWEYESEIVGNREHYRTFNSGLYDKVSGLYFDNCKVQFINVKSKITIKLPMTNEHINQIRKMIFKGFENSSEIVHENLFCSLEEFLNVI